MNTPFFRKTVLAMISLALVWGALSSCTQGTQGIFYGLEREQKITTASDALNKNITITSMAKGSGKYFIATGAALFSRDVSGTSWVQVVVAGQTCVTSVGAIKDVGSTYHIYAVAGPDSSNSYLYTSTNDGNSWSLVSLGGQNVLTTLPIMGSDGVTVAGILVQTVVSNDYKTVYLIDTQNAQNMLSSDLASLATSSLGLSPALSGLGNSVRSVVVDSTTTNLSGGGGTFNFYLINNNFLWQLQITAGAQQASPASKVVASSSNLSSAESWGSLLYQATGPKMFVGTSNGNLWILGTPSSWSSASQVTSNASIVGVGVKFSAMIVGANSAILLGSQTTGYSDYITGFNASPTSTSTDVNNYNSTVLPKSAVTMFFVDGTKLFLGTRGNGLWLQDSSTGLGWSQQ